MIEVNLKDAEGQLEQLIEEAVAGEEVVITSASGSAVRLVAQAVEAGATLLSSDRHFSRIDGLTWLSFPVG